MSAAFIDSLNAEIERLEKAIERIPEVAQLRELQRVRSLYGATPVSSPMGPTGPMPTSVTPEQHLPETGRLMAMAADRSGPGRKMAPDRQRALEIVTDTLKDETLPIRTAHLSHIIEERGIKLGGEDPVNSLSALLSTSGQFQAHGRSGWTLKRATQVEQSEAAERMQSD